jgi:ssDNA-binding Zn-finger/Zn-ribbon topoisomerase 1
MARCSNCETDLTYVETELIELHGYEDAVEMKSGEEGDRQAVATVCPDCDVLLSL